MPTIRVLDIIDIFIVTVLIYQLLLLIRGTRAVQLVTGVVILILAYAISRAVGLYTLQFVLQYLGVVIPIALLVIFQPELRRMLEQLGRGGVLVSGLAPGWGLPSRPMRWRLSCRRRRGPSRWPARGSSSAACRKKN